MSVTPKGVWPAVKAMLQSVYDQPDPTAVQAQFDRLLDFFDEKLLAVHEYLDAARADIRAFDCLVDPDLVRHPAKRINREIRRRTVAVGIVLNRAAILRPVGAVLAEQTDEWAEGNGYLELDVQARCRLSIVANTEPEIGAKGLPTLIA